MALIVRQEKILGATNIATIDTYEFLGDCYKKLERFDDLIAHYQQKRDQLFLAGDETKQSLRIFFLLLYSLFYAKYYLEAITHFKVLIEKEERILSQIHQDTLISYMCLASCYKEAQRYDDISEVCAEKIERFQSIEGVEEGVEEQFCLLISHIAKIFYCAGYNKRAIELHQYMVAKLEWRFGEDYLPTLVERVQLGWCHESRRPYTAALATYEAAFDGLERLKTAGKETNEEILTLLGEDIPKIKEHIANGEGEEWSSEEEDSDEESEDNDANGSDMALEDYIDLDGLECLVDAELLMF